MTTYNFKSPGFFETRDWALTVTNQKGRIYVKASEAHALARLIDWAIRKQGEKRDPNGDFLVTSSPRLCWVTTRSGQILLGHGVEVEELRQNLENLRRKWGVMTQGLRQRFWSKVDKRGPDECWPWKGGKTGLGDGNFYIGKKHIMARRFAWEQHYDHAVPYDMVIIAMCRNRSCCNPGHLRCGTRFDVYKVNPPLARPGPKPKLDEHKVREIRTSQLTGRQLAKKFGVSPSVISSVKRGRTWKWVC